jgi:hypothetical protein
MDGGERAERGNMLRGQQEHCYKWAKLRRPLPQGPRLPQCPSAHGQECNSQYSLTCSGRFRVQHAISTGANESGCVTRARIPDRPACESHPPDANSSLTPVASPESEWVGSRATWVATALLRMLKSTNHHFACFQICSGRTDQRRHCSCRFHGNITVALRGWRIKCVRLQPPKCHRGKQISLAQ